MKYKIFTIFILFFILTSKSFALVSVDITRGNLDPLPTAISDFYLDPKLGDNIKKLQLESKIPELIQNNLSRSGLFFALEKKSFIQRPEPAHNKPRFEDWIFIKTQVLVTGKISLEKEDRLRVEFKLWDVVSATELSALAFYTTPDNWRRVSHMISDKIYERLTGEKGYFDSRIIYVSETGTKVDKKKRLAVMDQDGYGVKYLTLGNELVLTPRFSPTSQHVTYMSYFRNLPRVYLLNIETGIQDLVGDFPGMTFAPRFSPDGKKIIMSFAQEGNSDIYTMDIKTRVVEKLTDHPSIDTSPSYSPDGSYITFNSDRSGFQQIYTMKSDGTNIKRISFGEGLYGTPVWSPRGDLIAFTKLYRNKFYIGVMRSDGSGERLLTENYYQEAPSWAPNGRVLIFYRETPSDSSGRGGGAKLWSIDLTGYNERLILTPTDASDPSWSGLLSGK
ncbi:MAG: Tol-Pal system protein TolB [Alphaproteobacteria bacterium]|jgi:TolB protein|nr:Tol-Pal system protein TolB [Alphaproteobacteria bacterium]